MEQVPVKKPFYKTWWGILLIILFLPIAIMIYLSRAIWKTKLKTPYRLAAIAALWGVVMIGSNANNAASTQQAEVKALTTTNDARQATPTSSPIPTSTPAPTVITVPTKKYSLPTPTKKPFVAPIRSNTTSTSNTQTAPATGNTVSAGGDKNCSDFSSQAQAQAYFNSKGGSAANNVDELDGNDSDGIVCESLK